MKNTFSLLFKHLILLTIILISCAKEPNPAVPYLPSLEEGSDDLVGESSSLAFIFDGRDFLGTQCKISLTQVEQSEGKENISWIMDIDYLLHGEKLNSSILRPYIYNRTQRTYSLYQNQKFETGETLHLFGILTRNSLTDPNQLDQYEQNGELIFSVHVELKDPSFHEAFINFLSATKEVQGNPELFNTYFAQLDQIKRIRFKSFHSNHYDSGGCLDYAPFEVVEKE